MGITIDVNRQMYFLPLVSGDQLPLLHLSPVRFLCTFLYLGNLSDNSLRYFLSSLHFNFKVVTWRALILYFNW